MADLPSGTVTLLFTDIEGSTRLLQQQGERYSDLLNEYRTLLRSVFARHGGLEVDTQGDSFFVVFPRAADAAAAAVAAQQAISTHPWPDGVSFPTRMGLHTGEPEVRAGNYVGLDVHRAARLMAAGHGGQILLSDATRAVVGHALPAGVELRDLGEHRLKDLQQPERIFQLIIPDLPSDFPSLKSLDARPNNLPLQRTAPLGRERDVVALTAMLQRADVGLVTLTGPGGVGKTTLSLQVATHLLDAFPDGVWFVDLAPIADPAFVAATIATTLGVTEAGAQPLSERLQVFLREKHLLLVLDNFEQVVAAAALVADLLKTAPKVKVLVTSRTVLHLYGEQEYAVAPLDLPDLRHLPPLAQLSQYAAVALFIQRARAVQPDFQVTHDNAPAVAEICARLDGLPLAIELAAARVKLFPPQALLRRLDQRLKTLTGGARDLPARQQTLRGAIEWSYNLLHPDEQMLFARLGVFVGGCTMEAAELVCNADSDLTIDVLDGLQALIDQSLLRQTEGAAHEPRFGMLETIREYALERLAARGDVELLQQHHAAYYLRFAESTAPELASAQSRSGFARLDDELDNLREALRWGIARGDTELALRLIIAIGVFWAWHAPASEGRAWLQAALALPGPRMGAVAATLRARALVQAGFLAVMQYDLAPAQRSLAEARALFQEADAKSDMAFACRGLAYVASMQGDYQRAQPYLEESLTLCQEVGDHVGIAWSLHDLGTCLLWAGAIERATPLIEESLARFQDLNQFGIMMALLSAGHLARAQGDDDRAICRYREALRLEQLAGNKLMFATALMAVAALKGGQGAVLDAARLGGAAENVASEILTISMPRGEREAYERALATARSQVDAATWEAAWAEGRTMTLEQAIAYALEGTAPAAESR